MTVHDIPKPFDIEGLAARWEVAPGTIYRMIKRGDLKAFRAGKSPLRISAAEVLRIEGGECGGLSSIAESGVPSGDTTEKPSERPFIPRIVGKPNDD